MDATAWRENQTVVFPQPFVRSPNQTIDRPAPSLPESLPSEIRETLQQRLAVLSLCLSVFGLVCLIWDSFAHSLDTSVEVGLRAFLLFCCGTLTVASFHLHRSVVSSLSWLRRWEAIIVGLPVLYCGLQFGVMLPEELAEDGTGFLFRMGSIWIVLIYSYGLFIPNTTRRALAVTHCIALTPLSISLVHASVYPSVSGELVNVIFLGIVLSFATWTSSIKAGRFAQLRSELIQSRQFGQYTLGEQIASGGMGDIYMAEHAMMKRPAVIKLIRPELIQRTQSLLRFEQEAHAIASLSHWHIVEIYDYGIALDGTYYLVMEYLPGETLHQIVRRTGALTAERTLHFAKQTCSALIEAHANDLIHRDIKPDNILASTRGHQFDVAKLIDFGLAESGKNAARSNDSLAGTPNFMAPEQLMTRANLDHRSDIYSFGATLFFLISGEVPFRHLSGSNLLDPNQRRVPRSLRSIAPHVDPQLAEIIDRCLQFEANDRFQSARDLMAALELVECGARWSSEQARQWWQEYRERDGSSTPLLEPAESDEITTLSIPIERSPLPSNPAVAT